MYEIQIHAIYREDTRAQRFVYSIPYLTSCPGSCVSTRLIYHNLTSIYLMYVHVDKEACF